VVHTAIAIARPRSIPIQAFTGSASARQTICARSFFQFIHLSERQAHERAACKALEDQPGQALFERHGRTLQLTEAGRVALGYANALFERRTRRVGGGVDAAEFSIRISEVNVRRSDVDVRRNFVVEVDDMAMSRLIAWRDSPCPRSAGRGHGTNVRMGRSSSIAFFLK